jgi:uncharacterized membrane protein YraQ (UPF0718 family)
MRKTEESYAGWYFLLIVAVMFIFTAFLKPDVIAPSLQFFLSIIARVVPILILVFILMVLINYFVSPQKLVRYIGKSAGIRRWVIAIVTGIISTGPIYLWYPLLSELKKQGVSYGFIAAFLYNRAIKVPLMPLMIFYFGLAYVIVLTVVMAIVSIFQGLIVEKFTEAKK